MQLWSAERVFVKGRFERDWALMVDDEGVIQAVGPRSQMVSKADTVFFYPQSVLMPSFVNPHHIGYHTLFKGVAGQTTHLDALTRRMIWPLSQTVDQELLEALYVVAFAEQARSGVGTVGEFHYLHNGARKVASEEHNWAEVIVDIAREMGLRITLVYAFFDQGDPEETQAFMEPLSISLKKFEALQERFADDPAVRIVPGIHSLTHTSPESVVMAGELAQKYGLPLHIPLAESADELKTTEVNYGTTPLRALEMMEVVDEHLVVIHGNLLEQEEFQRIKERNACMVLCPGASCAKGLGLPQAVELLEYRIPFCLGSDSPCLGNAYGGPAEIRHLEYVQRIQQTTMNVLNRQSFSSTLWDLVSAQAARAVGGHDGGLMPGAPADFILVNLDGSSFRPRWSFSTEPFLNQIIYGWGAQTRVSHLVVAGRMAMNQGHVASPRLEQSYQKLEQWSDAFMRSVGRSGDSRRERHDQTGAG